MGLALIGDEAYDAWPWNKVGANLKPPKKVKRRKVAEKGRLPEET